MRSSLAIRLQHSSKPLTVSISPNNARDIWEDKWLRFILTAFLSSLGFYSSQAIIKRQNNVLNVSIMVSPKNPLLSAKRIAIRPWNPNNWKRFQTLHLKLLWERISLFKALWRSWFNTELILNLTITKNIYLSSSLLSHVIRPNLLDSSIRSKYRQRLKANRVLAIYLRNYKNLLPHYSLPQSWKNSSEELKDSYDYLLYGYSYLVESFVISYVWRSFMSSIWGHYKNNMRQINNTLHLLQNPTTAFKSLEITKWREYQGSFNKLPISLLNWLMLSSHVYPLNSSMQNSYPYLIQIIRNIFWQDIQNQGMNMTMTGQLHRHVRTAKFNKKVGYFSSNSANIPTQHTHFHIRTKYGVWGFHVDIT